MVAPLNIGAGWTVGPGWTIGTGTNAPTFTVTSTDYVNYSSGAGSRMTASIDGYSLLYPANMVDAVYNMNTETGSINTTIQAAYTTAGYNISNAYAWQARWASYTPPGATGSGSLYFYNNSYLSIASGSAFDQNTGAWTVEAFVQPQSGGGTGYIYAENTNEMFLLVYDGSTTFSVDQSGVGYQINSAASFPPDGSWYHVAMAYNGSTTLTLYVNGTNQGTFAVSPAQMSASNNELEIGAYSVAQFFYGHITNVRVTQGVEVYTGAFTPPTAPLQNTQASGSNISAITSGQVQLLLDASTSGTATTDTSANALSVNNNNNVVWDIANPFSAATVPNYSCIVRLSGGNQFDITTIDQSNTDWQAGTVTGPSLLGTFTLPVTLTVYTPTTVLSGAGDWC